MCVLRCWKWGEASNVLITHRKYLIDIFSYLKLHSCCEWRIELFLSHSCLACFFSFSWYINGIVFWVCCFVTLDARGDWTFSDFLFTVKIQCWHTRARSNEQNTLLPVHKHNMLGLWLRIRIRMLFCLWSPNWVRNGVSRMEKKKIIWKIFQRSFVERSFVTICHRLSVSFSVFSFFEPELKADEPSFQNECGRLRAVCKPDNRLSLKFSFDPYAFAWRKKRRNIQTIFSFSNGI